MAAPAKNTTSSQAAPEKSAATAMRSLQRALDLLTVLQTFQHPVRLTDLAKQTGLHITTVQRLLAVLVDNGFAVRYAAGYTAGPAALSIAHAFLVSSPLTMIAQPIMQALSAESGLTSSLYVEVGDTRVLVARVEGSNPLRYDLPVGERLPLHLGAAGKAILSRWDEPRLHGLVEALPDLRRADGSVQERSDFLAELADVRSRGTARSASERVLGVTAIAAPILDGAGAVQGALGLTGPSAELPDSTVDRLLPEIRRAAAAIGSRLPAGP